MNYFISVANDVGRNSTIKENKPMQNKRKILKSYTKIVGSDQEMTDVNALYLNAVNELLQVSLCHAHLNIGVWQWLMRLFTHLLVEHAFDKHQIN